MKTHVINVQLRISANDCVSNADILNDLHDLLSEIQEQPPYRSTDGAAWWTNSSQAVSAGYEDAAEQLRAEDDPDYRHRPHGFPPPTHEFAGSNSDRQCVGLPGHCEDCAQTGHVAAHPDLGCGDVGCNSDH